MSPRAAGFTLIETLLAIAVVALAAGMVMVNFGGVTQTERLRSAARKLRRVLRQPAPATMLSAVCTHLGRGLVRTTATGRDDGASPRRRDDVMPCRVNGTSLP